MMSLDAALAYGRRHGVRFLVVNDEGGVLGGCRTRAQAEAMCARWNREFESNRNWYGSVTAHVVESD